VEFQAFFDGSVKQLLWVYDVQGNRVKPDVVAANASNCLVAIPAVNPQSQLSPGPRLYETDTLNGHPCWSLGFLNATIHMDTPSQGIHREGARLFGGRGQLAARDQRGQRSLRFP
jgi:hypothetical protein